jgi:hypothetical protein
MRRSTDLKIDPPAALAALVGVLACLVFAGVAAAPKSTYWWLAGELGAIENATALAYVAGMVIAIRLALGTQGWIRVHWCMWAVFCFLFFGEETSWMQHWLGFATPDTLRAHNAQSEFNLHNLDVFSANTQIFTAQGVSLSWTALLNSTLLFEIGFTLYFLMLPIAMCVPAIRDLGRRFGVPQLGTRFVLMVWLPLIVNVWLTIASRGDPEVKALVAESRELYFAVAIAIFTAIARIAVRHRRAAVAPGTRAAAISSSR